MRQGWLDQIQVATPCEARWDEMSGTDQVRHCGECRKNVYNLSALTRSAAETLVLETEGPMCVSFYRRDDGTLLTQDCPMGIAERAKATGQVLVRAALFVFLFAAAWFAAATGHPRPLPEFSLPSWSSLFRRQPAVMGAMVMDVPPSTPRPVKGLRTFGGLDR